MPGTKTEASRASVPLLPALARELYAHRQRQARLGFERLQPGSLVFVTRTGKSPGRRNVLRAVQRAAEKIGLWGPGAQPVGLHDLRHSAAGVAFESLALNEVSRLLRQESSGHGRCHGGISDEAAAAIGGKLTAAGFGA